MREAPRAVGGASIVVAVLKKAAARARVYVERAQWALGVGRVGGVVAAEDRCVCLLFGHRLLACSFEGAELT